MDRPNSSLEGAWYERFQLFLSRTDLQKIEKRGHLKPYATPIHQQRSLHEVCLFLHFFRWATSSLYKNLGIGKTRRCRTQNAQSL